MIALGHILGTKFVDRSKHTTPRRCGLVDAQRAQGRPGSRPLIEIAGGSAMIERTCHRYQPGPSALCNAFILLGQPPTTQNAYILRPGSTTHSARIKADWRPQPATDIHCSATIGRSRQRCVDRARPGVDQYSTPRSTATRWATRATPPPDNRPVDQQAAAVAVLPISTALLRDQLNARAPC